MLTERQEERLRQAVAESDLLSVFLQGILGAHEVKSLTEKQRATWMMDARRQAKAVVALLGEVPVLASEDAEGVQG
jgi:hypothetical protein